MEPLLVRFEKKQRNIIRRIAKGRDVSEAQIIRECVEYAVNTKEGVPKSFQEMKTILAGV